MFPSPGEIWRSRYLITSCPLCFPPQVRYEDHVTLSHRARCVSLPRWDMKITLPYHIVPVVFPSPGEIWRSRYPITSCPLCFTRQVRCDDAGYYTCTTTIRGAKGKSQNNTKTEALKVTGMHRTSSPPLLWFTAYVVDRTARNNYIISRRFVIVWTWHG